jgi:ribose transport system ATP-binding protein
VTTEQTTTLPPVLAVRDVAKVFGPTVALDKVSFEIARGSVHALIGENGAGKSTLVKIANGVIQPDAGSVELFGDQVRLSSPGRAAALGIATAYQEGSLVSNLSVAENLFLGTTVRDSGPLNRQRKLQTRTHEHFFDLGIEGISPNWLVEDLTLPEKQTVEIAKALRDSPRLIFFDEASSALAGDGLSWFFGLVERLRNEGRTVVFITHRLGEFRGVCDTVTVLRNGRAVGSYEVDEVSDSEIVRLMIGRSLGDWARARTSTEERPTALETRGLTRLPGFSDVDLKLGKGEILGVAGLDGQGQREFFLSLFGVLRSQSGSVAINGSEVDIRSPRDAISSKIGISLVPEDRATQGLFLKLPVWMNIALPTLDQLSNGGWIDRSRVFDQVKSVAQRLGLDEGVLGSETSLLSGGNQQKVVIGKWILAQTNLLLLYDPTRGVDIGTKFEIHKLIAELADSGISVLFYSSEVPEVVGLAERVVVFYRSRLVAELDGDDQNEEQVLAAAVGQTEVEAG